MISEFAKEKVFWTRKMNLKLVYFIKNNPNVWNPKHPKYTSVEHKDQTYAEFAALYGNKFTGQAVKNRWTNIRSTFANYLRKLNASRANGESVVEPAAAAAVAQIGNLIKEVPQAQNTIIKYRYLYNHVLVRCYRSQDNPENTIGEYKINWHLWGPCQFLMKVNRTVKDSLNINQTEEEKNSALTDDQYNSGENIAENTFLDDTNHCRAIVENLVNAFKKIQNDPFGLDKTKYGEIGRTVSKRLSEMNSYDAARATVKITEILLLYDEHNLINPNNFKHEL